MQTHDKFLMVIDNLLTEIECDDLITLFGTQKSEYVDRSIAEYERVEIDDEAFAHTLWTRISHLVPATFNGGKVMGLNSHFRFSKYHPGMEFGIHRDGVNQDQHGHRSAMTLNIFLNEFFDGGETDFFHEDKSLRQSVTPKTGRAALFDGQQYHCGNKVSNGCKFLLRTDVMIN
jgi:prolyl 4-hydroxylase